MRVPLSWLGEYVDLEPGTTPERGARRPRLRRARGGGRPHVRDLRSRRRRPGARVRGGAADATARPSAGARCASRRTAQKAADGGDDVRGIVCGARNFFAGDKVVVTAARRGAARAVPDRRPQDLRARLRRHDRLRPRARARRRARRASCASRRSGSTRRSAPTPSRCWDSTTRPSRSTSRPTAATRSRSAASRASTRTRPVRSSATRPRPPRSCRSARTRHGFPRARSTTRPPSADASAPRVFVTRVVRDVDGAPADPGVDDRAPQARGHPLDLARRRHHQLRDARARPADPRLRPRQARPAASSCGARTPGEKLVTLDDQARTLDPEDLLITDDVRRRSGSPA